MTFSEKLDFLMKLTKTKNSVLALQLSFDPSHISRLRSGQRSLPKKHDFIFPMAEYFAKQIKEEYQNEALKEVMRIHREPSDEAALADLIHRWLAREDQDTSRLAEGFWDNLSYLQLKKQLPVPFSAAEQLPARSVTFYYGETGKREAALSFLSCVLRQNGPQTLLLFSDEEMSWLFDSQECMLKWSALLKQILEKGSQIKIIHTISRNTDEMQKGISRWLPIYMAGAMEPYYYPKIRDGVLNRTLFISSECGAITSTSIQNKTEGMLNLWITDKTAVEALTLEYEQLLSLCKPLMQVFTPQSEKHYRMILQEFENERANTVIKSPFLSSITMPDQEAYEISRRLDNPDLYAEYKKRSEHFISSLAEHSIYEIITIPDMAALTRGTVPIAFFDTYLTLDAYYTPREFRRHLLHIVTLLIEYENYHVIFSQNIAEQYTLFAKEDLGVLITKTTAPFGALVITETNMLSALWEYWVYDSGRKKQSGRDKIIARLQAIANMLEKYEAFPGANESAIV